MQERGLVHLAIKKMHLENYRDEVIDIGYIGLCKGINTYKEECGYKKSTYYMACIENELKRWMKDRSALRRYLTYNSRSLDEEVEEGGDPLIEFVASNDNVEKEALDGLILDELLNIIVMFKDKPRMVMYYYYYEGISIRQIGRKIGISASRVNQYIKEYTVKLRNTYNKRGAK
jgi:RNA polymerase sporulation-specific sigma factor